MEIPNRPDTQRRPWARWAVVAALVVAGLVMLVWGALFDGGAVSNVLCAAATIGAVLVYEDGKRR